MRSIIQVRYVYKKPDPVNPSYIQKKLYSIIKGSILDLARVIDTSLVLQKSFQRNRNVHAQPLNHLTNLGDRYFYHPIPFVDVPLITQKRDSWHSVAFSNFSLDTFVPNLVSLTQLSLQILGKTQTGVFLISGFLVMPL